MYVKQFQKNCFHFRFLHNKPQIALLTTELSLLTCFFPKIINPPNDDRVALSPTDTVYFFNPHVIKRCNLLIYDD